MPSRGKPDDQEVGAPGGGIEGDSQVGHGGQGVGPGFLFEEDHLAPAALVGVAEEALARDEDGGVAGVHGTFFETLDPDGAEAPCLHFTGSGDVNTESGS